MKAKRETTSFSPLTPDRWKDFENLFGERGACGGCWCMLWRRSRAEFEAGKGAGNRTAMKRIVDSGGRPGLLAYLDGVPVGWCSVSPRRCFPALARSRVLKAVDETPVWSITCLFVRKSHRRRGLSIELLKAAARFVASCGGTVIEGYPVEPRRTALPAPFVWTGLASAFLKAGYAEHHRASATRPVMRMTVRQVRKSHPNTYPGR